MNNAIINLSLLQLFFAFLIPLIIILISKANHLDKEKDILRISIKMTVQLFLLGYVLLFLLRRLPPYIGVFYVFLMLFFASRTLKNRLKHLNNKFIRNGSISMGLEVFFYLHTLL